MKRLTVFLVFFLAIQLAVPCSKSAAGAPVGTWVSINTDGLKCESVNCIALDPQHTGIIYAGSGGIAETGDLFKSTDGGSTWKAMKVTSSGMQDVTGIDSILVDPFNASVVFARTFGSVTTSHGTSVVHRGVIKSTDGGLTWRAVNDGLPTDEVWSLAMDPTSTAVLYAGTTSGLFKSNDGGTTWEKVNDGPEYGALGAPVINPSNPSVMYALAGGSAFKSSDGGLAWSPVEDGILSESYVRCLTLDPIDPSIVYAGTNVGLFKSGDAGATWNKTGGGLYADSIVIDSTDTSTIYVCTAFDGLFKSTDGGLTWREINRGLEGRWVGSLVQDPSNTSVLYVEAGNGGVLKSTDGGLTWNTVNIGLERPLAPEDDFSVWLAGVDPADSSVLYVSTSSGLFKTTDRGTSWRPINDGLRYDGVVSSFAIDPLHTSILYATLVKSSDWANLGLFKSVDGGSHWAKASEVYVGDGCIESLAIDASTTSTVYAGLPGGVSKSTDGGSTWSAPATSFDAEETWITALAIDPTNTAVVYAGNLAYGGFRSADGGSTWTRFASGLDKAGTVYCILIDPSNASVLYAGVGPIAGLDDDEGDTGVFKSTDAGSTWTASNTGLGTTTIVTALAMDPATPAVLYAATWGGGVFRSTDAGDHWQNISDGLTTEFVGEVVLGSQPSGVLYSRTSDGNISRWMPGTASTTAPPSFPAGLTATPSVTDIRLDWSAATAGTSPLGGYTVYRSLTRGDLAATAVATVDAAVTSWTDTTCQQGMTYYYSVAAFDSQATPLASARSSEVSAQLLPVPPLPVAVTLTLQLDNALMLVSGSDGTNDTVTLDVAPMLGAGNRTLVPVRAVAEAMGGTAFWDVITQTASVTVGSNTLELTLGKNTALFNGTAKPIDTDPNVVPIIIDGRTMLPLRFIVESLGAEVSYDQATKTITITYTKS